MLRVSVVERLRCTVIRIVGLETDGMGLPRDRGLAISMLYHAGYPNHAIDVLMVKVVYRIGVDRTTHYVGETMVLLDGRTVDRPMLRIGGLCGIVRRLAVHDSVVELN